MPDIPQTPVTQAEAIQTPIQAPVSPPPQSPPPQAETEPTDSSIYPQINITKIENPSRFYAIPFLGFLVKIIIMIPAFIFIWSVSFASFFLTFLNSFVVLFTGKYWQTAFDLNKGLLSWNLKYIYYLFGLTNKYPGFSLDIKDDFSLNIEYPSQSSRIFAFPIIGGLIRIVMIIPFAIFYLIIFYGAIIGSWGASFLVLFRGRHPDSVFELARDSGRLMLASSMYSLGLSDRYPSFKISWDHKAIKIVLIILGALYFTYMVISPFKQNQNIQYDTIQSKPTQMVLPQTEGSER